MDSSVKLKSSWKRKANPNGTLRFLVVSVEMWKTRWLPAVILLKLALDWSSADYHPKRNLHNPVSIWDGKLTNQNPVNSPPSGVPITHLGGGTSQIKAVDLLTIKEVTSLTIMVEEVGYFRSPFCPQTATGRSNKSFAFCDFPLNLHTYLWAHS